MKKTIMLTILVVYVILVFVGCKSGRLFIDRSDSSFRDSDTINNQENSFDKSGEYEEPSGEVASSGDIESNNNEEVVENFVYNESGKIIIAMFHRFADSDLDEWTRSYDNFYNDLKYLYDHNYRTVSLNDYLNNSMKVPVGCTPIVLTFDDGSKGQFNLIKNDDDKLVANPKSAVGIMEKFYSEYPEFGLNGTFFINSTFFAGEGTNEERLKYLVDRGFEIGNHTSSHVNFSKASVDTIQKEVGTISNMVRKLVDGYEITALALPYGISSKDYKSYIAKGEFDGQTYENKVLLLVGANPALPVTNEKVNLLALPRVRATGGGKSVECDLYYWLDVMEKNPKMKYERIS